MKKNKINSSKHHAKRMNRSHDLAHDDNSINYVSNSHKMVMGDDDPVISYDKNSTFPDIAHFIWFGKKLPYYAASNIFHFKKNNKKYHVILWSNNPEKIKNNLIERGYSSAFLKHINIHTFPQYSNHELSAAIARESSESLYQNLPAASDLARLGVLYKYGGIYLDVDVRVRGKLDGIVSQENAEKDMLALISHDSVANGVMIAKQGKKILEDIISCVTLPYKGKLYDPDAKTEIDFSTEIMKIDRCNRARGKKSITDNIGEVMWEEKRKRNRLAITVVITGPGVLPNFLNHSDTIQKKNQFGQFNYNIRTDGWREDINADGGNLLLTGRNRRSSV